MPPKICPQEDQQQNAPDRDAVEKSLLHVGGQADDKHRNPPTLEVKVWGSRRGGHGDILHPQKNRRSERYVVDGNQKSGECSPVEGTGSLESRYLKGFIDPRWCTIASINIIWELFFVLDA